MCGCVCGEFPERCASGVQGAALPYAPAPDHAEEEQERESARSARTDRLVQFDEGAVDRFHEFASPVDNVAALTVAEGEGGGRGPKIYS